MATEAGSRQYSRDKDAERTKTEILEAATEEFAAAGFSGARIDEVARKTSASKGMIYYYFENKEGLYLAVLERAYRQIREVESALDVDALPPLAAIRTLAQRSFDYHVAHREFVRLVTIENVNNAQYLSKLKSVSALGTPILDIIERILKRGWADGSIRPDVEAKQVHLLISALSVFPESGGQTFRQLFDFDLRSRETIDRTRAMIGDLVDRWLAA